MSRLDLSPTELSHSYGTAFDAADLSPVRVDLEMAWNFLDALDPNGYFTFQTFPDHGPKKPRLTRILHGHANFETLDRLSELHEFGAGIFVTVNTTDGHGRRAGNITGVRALFVDGDDCHKPEHWHVSPDLVVSRDELHWHAYWLCHDMCVTDFSMAQKRLIQNYGTDGAIHDITRVMRVPGFLHQKSTPLLVNFEDMRS